MSGETLHPKAMFGHALEGLAHASRPKPGWKIPTIGELGLELPAYSIIALIGRGGMGAVYQARQESLDRTVAIKILPPGIGHDEDLLFTVRFEQEARAMAKLGHPGIVAVHEAGETPAGVRYFVMEFVEGCDVSALISRHGRLPVEEALRIARAVCDALTYAHRQGVVHRDIKPSNVMIGTDGTVKIADFGLAKIHTPDSGGFTRSDLALGSPDYIAPECLVPGQRPDARADVYSTGVMLYQMLTGRLPRGRFERPSGIVEGLDSRLDAIIDKALQTDPGKRYPSAAGLSADLAHVPCRTAAGIKRLLPLAALVVAGIVAVCLLAVADNKPAPRPGELAAEPPSVPSRRWKSQTPDARLLKVAGDGWWLRTGSAHENPNYSAVLDRNQRGKRICNGGVRAERRIPAGEFRDVLLSVRHDGEARHYELFLSVPADPRSECCMRILETSRAAATSGSAGSGPWRNLTLASMEFPHPGKIVTVELVAVAGTMRARLNDHVLTRELESGVQSGMLMLRGAGTIPFRNLEYLDLDGLPESEARHHAGIDTPGRAAPLPSKPELLREAKDFGGHSYAWVARPASWIEAEAIAHQAGGSLVTIDSPEEQRWLLQHSGKWFIGGKRKHPAADPAPQPAFTWIDGRPVHFDGWMPGAPSGQRYMGISSRRNEVGWLDLPVVDPSVDGFIVEWAPELPAAPDPEPPAAATR